LTAAEAAVALKLSNERREAGLLLREVMSLLHYTDKCLLYKVFGSPCRFKQFHPANDGITKNTGDVFGVNGN
jgi:hypothetical protein